MSLSRYPYPGRIQSRAPATCKRKREACVVVDDMFGADESVVLPTSAVSLALARVIAPQHDPKPGGWSPGASAAMRLERQPGPGGVRTR